MGPPSVSHFSFLFGPSKGTLRDGLFVASPVSGGAPKADLRVVGLMQPKITLFHLLFRNRCTLRDKWSRCILLHLHEIAVTFVSQSTFVFNCFLSTARRREFFASKDIEHVYQSQIIMSDDHDYLVESKTVDV